MTTIRPAPTCLQSRWSTCSLCFRKFTQAGGINAGEVSIVITVSSSVSPALKSVLTSRILLRRSDIAEHPPVHIDTAIPPARPVSVVPHMPTHGNSSGNSQALLSRDRRRLVNAPEQGSVADSFWQGSVVSVRACIRGRHRRAGSYRQAEHRQSSHSERVARSPDWRRPELSVSATPLAPAGASAAAGANEVGLVLSGEKE